MTDIPDDVMQAARDTWLAMGFVNDRLDQVHHIARAILAEREKSRKRVEELEALLRNFESNARAWMKPPRAGIPGWLERCVTEARALLRKEGTDA